MDGNFCNCETVYRRHFQEQDMSECWAYDNNRNGLYHILKSLMWSSVPVTWQAFTHSHNYHDYHDYDVWFSYPLYYTVGVYSGTYQTFPCLSCLLLCQTHNQWAVQVYLRCIQYCRTLWILLLALSISNILWLLIIPFTLTFRVAAAKTRYETLFGCFYAFS